MDELIGLFPTPFYRAQAILDDALVNALLTRFAPLASERNKSSTNLSHTQMLQPKDDLLLQKVAGAVLPKVIDFGAVMFGERLPWAVKEMWVNVLSKGGRQAMHNHANSFVSGVVYLTRTHPDSQTVFMKSPGGHDFHFRNDHAGIETNEFNADKWVSPAPAPGDLVLFPSYLMHAVPPNPGRERRVSLAFNAIPARLDSWGYAIEFDCP